jgi:hypothetical protein
LIPRDAHYTTGSPAQSSFTTAAVRVNRALARVLLAIDLIALLGCVSFATITAQGPSERALGRSAAILTEIDTYLDRYFPAVQQQAAQANDQRVTLPNFPLNVTFAPSEVQGASRDQFRALLLRRSGALLRRDGAAAFDQEGSSRGSRAAPGAWIRAALDLLRPRPHWASVGLGAALGVATIPLCFVLLAGESRRPPVRALALTLFASASAFFVLAAIGWLMLRVAATASHDYVTHQFLIVAGQLAWGPLRDGLIVMLGSLAFVVASWLLTANAGTRYPQPRLDTRGGVE